MRSLIVTAVLLAAVFGGLVWYQQDAGSAESDAGEPGPPIVVSAVEAQAETWHPLLTAVGSLRAVNGVEITPEVGGIVADLFFESGQEVPGGTLLVRLEDAVEQAQLKSNQANLKAVELELGRGRSLFQKGNFPKAQLDALEAKRDQAAAEVDRIRALIEEKQIRAPFEGRLGIRQADLGDYLAPGTPIVGLQALDPIFVDFSLPEQNLSRLAVGQAVRVRLDAYPSEVFTARLSAIDSQVNSNTRGIMVRADLANTRKLLLPGLFALVEVVLPAQEAVVTLPATAVSYGLYGDSVYVIQGAPAQLTVERRAVTLGERRDDRIAIAQGLGAGETVVSAGQLKLQSGSRVEIDNSVALTTPSPRPKE
ncbi:MAG: efflux RND transporter periplasmic adaptor subunit [Rhodospirillales bacterium]